MIEHKGKSRDAATTKAELLRVATEVFAESGYSGARVDEIAARTKTTKRMIYYYFGSKENIYKAVLEHAYQGIREAEKQIDVRQLGPVEAIRRVAELSYDYHVEHQDFIRIVAAENIQHGEHIKTMESLLEIGGPRLRLIETILEAGQSVGDFRSEVNAMDVQVMVSSFCVFQIANRYTFGFLFNTDLMAPASRDHYRTLIGDVVVSWLSHPQVGT